MIERLRQFFTGAPTAPTVRASVRPAGSRPAYEAGAHAPRTVGWTAPDVGANLATASNATIRTRARDAVRNDAWARAMVETLADDIVGWGIKPLSQAPDEATRQAIQALWDRWALVADADGLLDLAGLQALAVRTLIVDGEGFMRLRRRKVEDGLPVPLQVQILPPEMCPEEHTNGTTIRQGIEFDALGRRVAYHLRDVVPGEDSPGALSTQIHRVPGDQVLHLFDPLRPGQRRGVSWLAPALVRLHELDKFADAVLLRQQLSNLFVGMVKRAPGLADLDPLTGEAVGAATASTPSLTLAPGVFQHLDAGEDLTFNEPPDPPADFADYVKHELRAAGAAVGVPLECFTHDWGATNDRLARVVLNQYRRRVHRILWSLVVPQVLRPLWQQWFRLALLHGTLPPGALEPGADRVTFAPHAHAYVHPVQDVESYRAAIRAGLTSRAAAVAETGEDVEVIDAQIARDNARADGLGLRFDSDGRVGTGSTTTPNVDADEARR